MHIYIFIYQIPAQVYIYTCIQLHTYIIPHLWSCAWEWKELHTFGSEWISSDTISDAWLDPTLQGFIECGTLRSHSYSWPSCKLVQHSPDSPGALSFHVATTLILVRIVGRLDRTDELKLNLSWVACDSGTRCQTERPDEGLSVHNLMYMSWLFFCCMEWRCKSLWLSIQSQSNLSQCHVAITHGIKMQSADGS